MAMEGGRDERSDAEEVDIMQAETVQNVVPLLSLTASIGPDGSVVDKSLKEAAGIMTVEKEETMLSAENIAQISTPIANSAMPMQQTVSMSDAKPRVRKRRLQHVSTLQDRAAVMSWMRRQESIGEKNIPSKAVRTFPHMFQGTENANLMKASRMYKVRNEPLPDSSEDVYGRGKPKKAAPGRGRKVSAWTAALTEDVQKEALKMQNAGVTITTAAIKTLAHRLVLSDSHELYSSQLVGKITARWVQRFVSTSPMLNVKKVVPKSQKTDQEFAKTADDE